MKPSVLDCILLSKAEIAPGFFDYTVQAKQPFGPVAPGQFAHIAVPSKTLRRPISICDASEHERLLRFVFEVRGEGTKILSQLEPGAPVNLIAPIGNGFPLVPGGKRVVLVGGGIGVPPLVSLAKKYQSDAHAVLGFRHKDAVILTDDFVRAGCRVDITTDDGSFGVHGFVTDVLRTCLTSETACVYACGPTPMLKAVSTLCWERGVDCYVSLEERMACGVGACLGCACKVRLEDGSETFRHVCKDGPVFSAKEVCW